MNNILVLEVKTLPRNKWGDIRQLAVCKEQQKFIETSQKCLEDAKNDAYKMKWNFYGIYVESELVGFAMHGKLKIAFYSQVWLDRFMIDEKHQGKGYGKKALQMLVEKLHDEYGCKKIFLSVIEDNIPAINLYKKLGFKKTLFKDTKGERIMTRKM